MRPDFDKIMGRMQQEKTMGNGSFRENGGIFYPLNYEIINYSFDKEVRLFGLKHEIGNTRRYDR